MKFGLLILILAFLSTACAGMGGIGSASKTNKLRPGMTMSQVEGILGEPGSSQFVENHFVWKYRLQKPWVGWVPHYLAFTHDGTLVAWRENIQEYYATQALWIEALPKTIYHRVEVDGKIDHNVSGSIDHNVSGSIRVHE
jgi:hypothetical protein